MRLRSLNLVRYGKFTDRTIDFGPKPVATPDLHIVFGLNEAGKSTALSGYLDLLFGIEERSRYNFLHEYASMRIGGVMELAGEEQAFTRTKQRSNSLLNAAGQPVGEMAITSHLAGLSRDAYGAMFSLNDETLEAGGKAILESQGDLGKLLFSASAGLGRASDVIGALEAEADELHRKHAQGTELAVLKKRLAELKSKRDEIDTLASTFETLEADHRDATERYDRSLAERGALTARVETIVKYFRSIPILAEFRRKTARLAELPDIPIPRRTWSGTVAEMIEDHASLRTRLSANTSEVERVAEKVSAIDVDEVVLSTSERIRGLSERKMRYGAAGLDLPNRKTELQILDNSVASCLAALGRVTELDAATLLLPAATVGVVRHMVEQRSGIATATRVARDEAAAAADALHAARDRVSEDRGVSTAVKARLASALSKAKASEHAREARAAQEADDGSTVRWEAAVRRLPPWSGDASALAKIPSPNPWQVTAWKTRASDHAKDRLVLVGRLEEYEATHQTLSARLEKLRSAVDAEDDEAATSIRQARDDAWARHRKDLKAESADEFASIMVRDDTVVKNRLANVQELAEIRATTAALNDAASNIRRTREQLGRIDAEVQSLLSEICAATGDLVGQRLEASPEFQIELVEDCVNARSDALAAWQEIELARKAIERAAEELSQVHVELNTSLERVGLRQDSEASLEVAMAVADQFLQRQAKLEAERAEALKTVAAREEELTNRRRAVRVAESREEDWQTGITEALKGTWLESGLSAAEAGSVLDQLVELAKLLRERDALRLRIEKMETDREDFIAEVTTLAEQVYHAVDKEAEQTALQMAERLGRAEQSRETRSNLLDDQRRLQDSRNKLDVEIVLHDRRKNEVLSAFGVNSLAEVVERDEALKNRERLRIEAAELEEQLSSELSVHGQAQARELLDGLDVNCLAAEKAECEQRLQDLDGTLKEHLVRQTRAADKLDAIGSDSAVARIDTERRTVLLEIEQKATRYLQLRVGTMAAGSALRAYRDRHRSGMMSRASGAFAMMTRGHYSGLTTQPIKGGEVLIAMQADGKSKVADALSKGARFQLYLALRLAGYYEFAQFRPAVPFLADDIMETFDHVRSEEVFRLFAAMAGIGQVIYLTHHRHLCEIAKAVAPCVTIHELE